ncbi:MAG: hypothetical protein QOG97_261, partial [Acidimicrobiaceae bacterium]|nr:hypothetical protein [Acidimicrobiaceae bacterium]
RHLEDIIEHLDAPNSRERDMKVPVHAFGLLETREVQDQLAIFNC